MLFPDPLQFILPDVTATVNTPPQYDAVQVPLGSANLPRGIVTDLYMSLLGMIGRVSLMLCTDSPVHRVTVLAQCILGAL